MNLYILWSIFKNIKILILKYCSVEEEKGKSGLDKSTCIPIIIYHVMRVL